MERCDAEIFEKGQSLAALDARAVAAEAWVKKVAARSGERVDWHYSGGAAHVLVLGDHSKAAAAVEELRAELDGRVMCVYGPSDSGLYRANVTPLPDDAVAVVTTSGANEVIRGAP